MSADQPVSYASTKPGHYDAYGRYREVVDKIKSRCASLPISLCFVSTESDIADARNQMDELIRLAREAGTLAKQCDQKSMEWAGYRGL